VAEPAPSPAAEIAPASPSPRALVVEDSTPSAGLVEDSTPSAGLVEDSTPSVAPIAAFAESQPAVESNGKALVEAKKLPEIAAEPQKNGKEPEKNGKELQEANDFKNVSEAEGQQKVIPIDPPHQSTN